ncbi:unnamed protein product [Blepharisma stoltei]|uniref:Abasic site processing protein HMCES n=1 Tax=Blepharisma stoltei TaxID=1481888 RepID=A0AAU9ID70_9CILI|nr:unnamed protein product [Blepharisma stoltei]
MCGRVISRVDIPGLRAMTRARGSRRSGQLRRGYNIGPASHQAAIVHASRTSVEEETKPEECMEIDQNRVLSVMKWGMNNFREKNPEKPMVINIRIESMDYKFKPFHNNRCVILAEGYYEWKETHPYLVKPKNSDLFYFAGLYRDIDENEQEYGIITVPPKESMFWLHDRSPAMIREENIDRWIDPQVSYEEASALIECREAEELEYYEVPSLVNQMKNDNKECCMRVEEYQALLKTKGIHRFFKPVEKRKAEEEESLPAKKIIVAPVGNASDNKVSIGISLEKPEIQYDPDNKPKITANVSSSSTKKEIC